MIWSILARLFSALINLLRVLAATLKRRGRLTTHQLVDIIRIFKPETVIGWHRTLVCRK